MRNFNITIIGKSRREGYFDKQELEQWLTEMKVSTFEQNNLMSELEERETAVYQKIRVTKTNRNRYEAFNDGEYKNYTGGIIRGDREECRYLRIGNTLMWCIFNEDNSKACLRTILEYIQDRFECFYPRLYTIDTSAILLQLLDGVRSFEDFVCDFEDCRTYDTKSVTLTLGFDAVNTVQIIVKEDYPPRRTIGLKSINEDFTHTSSVITLQACEL